MNTKLLNQEGKETGEIELNQSIFGVEMNEGLVHRALVYQLSSARKVVAHTKTRGERRGSTRKIYKQKGTGRARMGSNRSPIRKKGGVVFGPRNNRNFTLKMNKKERRKVLFMILSEKLASNNLRVIDALSFDTVKTKNIVDFASKIDYTKNILMVLPSKDLNIEKSTSNVPYVKSILVNYLNVSDLLKYNTLVLLKDTLGKMEELFVK